MHEAEPVETSETPRRRRPPVLLLAGGGALAVVLGSMLAMGIFRDDPGDDTPPPAAEGGLKVELTQVDPSAIDPARPLRCFVDGAFVGELTLAQCAQRNGVAAQALDVGTDATGALSAVVGASPINTEPLGQEIIDAAPAPTFEAPPEPVAVAGPATGECLRHTGGEWRNLGDALPLDTCVQVLFSGRCEQPGGAQYGRWNGQSVRLVPGRVEIAPDGSSFRPLMQQDPATCSLR